MSYKIRTPRGMVTAQRVTEVIRRGLPSPELEAWKIREAVRYALAHPTLGSEDDDVAATVAAWEDDSRRSARRGTSVHKLVAAHLCGTEPEVPDEHAGYFDAFLKWRVTHVLPEDRLVEQTLLSRDMKVAGTADLIAGSHVYDWKTSERASTLPPFASHIAQLGAYSTMHWLVTDNELGEDPMPKITRAAIVRLHADGTYHEHAIEGNALAAAQRLWSHVRAVADAVKGTT